MNTKRIQIAYILAFPIVLSIGIVLIPVVSDYGDHTLAAQGVSQTGRWLAGHIIAAIGFALSSPAVASINQHLQRTSRSLPAVTLPGISVGAGLYAAGLGADGIGPLAVQSAGHTPVIFFDGSTMWVTGTFAAATLIFAIGLFSLISGAISSKLLLGWSRIVVFISALIFVSAPMIFSGWTLYGVAAASFGVLVPFARAVANDQ